MPWVSDLLEGGGPSNRDIWCKITGSILWDDLKMQANNKNQKIRHPKDPRTKFISASATTDQTSCVFFAFVVGIIVRRHFLTEIPPTGSPLS